MIKRELRDYNRLGWCSSVFMDIDDRKLFAELSRKYEEEFGSDMSRIKSENHPRVIALRAQQSAESIE
jgi:hypothetical protein